MKTDEKLEIFFELQSQGYTPAEIAPKLNMLEKALRNLLRRKNYTCIDGKYVSKDDSEPKPKKTASTTPATVAKTPQTTKTAAIPSKKNNIEKDIKEIKEILLAMQGAPLIANNIDEVATTIEPNTITGNEISIGSLKHFSIRADNDILNEFHELCKRYPNINKSYMFTLALKEFINNHS